MLPSVLALIAAARVFFRSRTDIAVEVLALRQQVAVLKRKRPKMAFLRNHREAIVAFDLFTVPTATFRVVYCFFVIEHARRRIMRFNVTRHPCV